MSRKIIPEPERPLFLYLLLVSRATLDLTLAAPTDVYPKPGSRLICYNSIIYVYKDDIP